jgi:hypothetical protein
MESDSTWLKRYAAQKALRYQLRQDHPILTGAASLPAGAVLAAAGPAALPVTYIGNEVLNNVAVNSTSRDKAQRNIEAAESKLRDRTWGQQFKQGLKAAPIWAIGGGLAGGLGTYLATKKPEWAIRAALGGAALGGVTPILMSLLAKNVVEKSDEKSLRHARKVNVNAPFTSALPLGDAILAKRYATNKLDRSLSKITV